MSASDGVGRTEGGWALALGICEISATTADKRKIFMRETASNAIAGSLRADHVAGSLPGSVRLLEKGDGLHGVLHIFEG